MDRRTSQVPENAPEQVGKRTDMMQKGAESMAPLSRNLRLPLSQVQSWRYSSPLNVPPSGPDSMASDLCFAHARIPSMDISPQRRTMRDRRRKRRPHFLELPYEVLMRILEFSCDNAEELVNFSLVCSTMNRFAAVESLWKRVCLNRFGFVHPSTVSRSGSWKSLLRNKALIENSPWTVKPREAANSLQNDYLGTFDLPPLRQLPLCLPCSSPLHASFAFSSPFSHTLLIILSSETP